MARPNFTTQLPSTYRFKTASSSGGPYTAAAAWSSSETVSGTNRRKPAGPWIAPTGYSLTAIEYRKAEGSCLANYVGTITKPPPYTYYYGCVGGSRFNSLNNFNEVLLESNMLDASLVNQALIKARSKMKQSSVNLGVAWAERSMTARLVGDTASRLARSFLYLKRRQVRRAMNELGITSSKREPRGSNVPNKWLELQYGWKPLLSDVYGACDALSKRNKADWRITAKASAKSEYYLEKSRDKVFAGTTSVRVERRALVRIDALPANETFVSLSSLGISNPLLIGWELVPYSFVVDWFLPVGNYLDGLDAMFGYDADNTWTSSTSFARALWEDTGGDGAEPDWVYQNRYYGYKRGVKMTRTVTNGVPLPWPPWVKNPASLGHMANGLALLSQAFGRR